MTTVVPSKDGEIEKARFSPGWIAFWTAIIYAFGVLILGGGAGIWLPAVMPTKSVGIDALTTFAMATLAPICVDLMLDLDIYGRRLSKLWRVSLVVGCIFAGALAIIALVREKASGEWAAGIIAVILSLIIWITFAMKSERFLPDGSKTGSIGGGKPATANLTGEGLPA
jgi:hypothetical protein